MRVIYWNRAEGGLSDYETAFDYVVLVMDGRVGDLVWLSGFPVLPQSLGMDYRFGSI